MSTQRFEDLERAAAREADRLMLFAALRERRAAAGPRRLVTALLWLLGVTR
jgi:hypothetical protein